MDLLEKFEAVTVETDHRITPEDKDFCEAHQAAYDAAVQSYRELVFFWEDMVNTQEELLKGIETDTRKYLCEHSSYDRLHISAEDIESHIKRLHRIFINTLVGHFNKTYNVSVDPRAVCDNLLPQEPSCRRYENEEAHKEYQEKLLAAHVRYQDVVDQIILLLDGRSFAEQAFYELTEKCHKAAWNLYQKEAEFERKKSTIRFNGYYCSAEQGYRQEDWRLNDKMKDILHGAAHFETDSYDFYPMGFSDLLAYRTYYNEHEFPTCKKIVSLKMFKNGRVDLKFSTDAYAEEFINTYLGAVC